MWLEQVAGNSGGPLGGGQHVRRDVHRPGRAGDDTADPGRGREAGLQAQFGGRVVLVGGARGGRADGRDRVTFEVTSNFEDFDAETGVVAKWPAVAAKGTGVGAASRAAPGRNPRGGRRSPGGSPPRRPRGSVRSGPHFCTRLPSLLRALGSCADRSRPPPDAPSPSAARVVRRLHAPPRPPPSPPPIPSSRSKTGRSPPSSPPRPSRSGPTAGTDSQPVAIVSGDFNRDGKLDVATANTGPTGSASCSGPGPAGTSRPSTSPSAVPRSVSWPPT